MYDSPNYPIGPDDRDWIESRMAWLVREFGRERLLSAPVVLPTPEYFPDPYDGSPEAVRVLLDRVCGYMGIRPETVDVQLYEEEHPPFLTEGPSEGTAGLYEDLGGTCRIWLEASNLDDLLDLVATMAHELGHVLLLGQQRVSPDEPDHEPLTDLLTVYFGLGVITGNSVIRERHWGDGLQSGWSVGRRGYLAMPMFGYALAIYAWERNEAHPAWARRLRPDVRQAFEQTSRTFAECWNAGLPKREVRPWAPSRDRVANPVGATNEGAPTEKGAEPEPVRCHFCGGALPATGEQDAVCDECRSSIERNEREVRAAAEKAAAEYQERARVSRTTCLVMALAAIAAVLWQVVRNLLK